MASPWLRRLGSLSGRTALLLAVLAALVLAADRSRLALDLSADRRFTLSPRLVELVHAQREPVELVGIWTAAVDPALAGVEAVAKRVAGLGARVAWSRIDPELQKPEFDALRARQGELIQPALYCLRNGRAFLISLHGGSRLTLQRDLASALLALDDPRPPSAWVMQGHGELRPGGGDEDGCDRLLRSLAMAGFQVATRAAGHDRRPDPDCLLVLPGPTRPLGGPDLQVVDEHLADGGPILLLGDDRLPADLCSWLRRRGVVHGAAWPRQVAELPDCSGGVLPPQILVALQSNATGRENGTAFHNLLLRDIQPRHPASAPAAQAGVLLFSPFSAQVEVAEPGALADAAPGLAERYAAAGTPSFQAVILAQGPAGDTWTKTRAAQIQVPEALDQTPPRPLAWAVEYAPTERSVQAGVGGRLVIWGSRQAASDGVLAQVQYGNELLLRGAADWLTRRGGRSGIPESEVARFQVLVGEEALWLCFALLVVLVPFLCLGAAMLTWWDRR